MSAVDGVPSCVYGVDSMGRKCVGSVPHGIYTRISYYWHVLKAGIDNSQPRSLPKNGAHTSTALFSLKTLLLSVAFKTRSIQTE